GDVVGVGELADLFNVYAHLAPLGESVGGERAAMRNVEAQVALPRPAGDRRLAMRLIDELQRFGRSTEPLAHKLAQPRTRDDIAAAVALEREARGTRSFIGRDQPHEGPGVDVEGVDDELMHGRGIRRSSTRSRDAPGA